MITTAEDVSRPAWHGPHARIRTDAYVLLAALLTDTPSADLIEIIRSLDWDSGIQEKLRQALSSLNSAGSASPPESIAGEYQLLFVGLGSGEMVPYGSWYLEKKIQSASLAAIRSDICSLGIVRKADAFESEDHAGALCEIMALLSNPDNGFSDCEQATFFENHISPWMGNFFMDLQQAENAQFYGAVGQFGQCFLDDEREYLQFAVCD